MEYRSLVFLSNGMKAGLVGKQWNYLQRKSGIRAGGDFKNFGFYFVFVFVLILFLKYFLYCYIVLINIFFIVVCEFVTWIYQFIFVFSDGYLGCWQFFIVIINRVVSIFVYF